MCMFSVVVLFTVGTSFWTDEVQESFDAKCNADGVVDRETFLSLLKEYQSDSDQEREPSPTPNSYTSTSRADVLSDANGWTDGPSTTIDKANFRKKLPSLGLKLGHGSAAAFGAVKIGLVRTVLLLGVIITTVL